MVSALPNSLSQAELGSDYPIVLPAITAELVATGGP
jgi:hypothetical protein